MRMITFRRLIHAAFVMGVSGAAGPALAATITFDQTITSPAPPTMPFGGLLDRYETPSLTPALTFETQGFQFGGFTRLVTGPSPTQPELHIILDPTLCPSPPFEAPCVSNGTQYLAADDPFGVSRGMELVYSLSTFDAAQVFGGQSPEISDATTLQVFGFRLGGVLVAQETFTLSPSFQTFVLTDPDWASVVRTVFLPLDATGAPGGVAIDNISVQAVQAVPEPASLVLLGTGIAGLVARRLRRGATS